MSSDQHSDDSVSLLSSIEPTNNVEPQPYTSDQAIAHDRMSRERTRDEEMESDEEYLDPKFNRDDMHDDLTIDQNIDLYLIRNQGDMIGNRHLSVGMENHRPSVVQDEAPSARRRSNSLAESLKRTGTFQSIQKFRLFDDNFKHDRWKVYSGFLVNYLVLGVGFVIVLAIYWGTYYNRNQRYHNLKFLVVVGEQTVDDVPPLIGEAIEYTASLSSVQSYGSWHVYNHSQFLPHAEKHGNTLEEELIRQVHHKKYWGGLYVKQNSTLKLYEMLTNSTQDFDTSFINAYYESGRDPTTVTNYVRSFLGVYETLFLQVASKSVYPTLISLLTEDQLSSIPAAAISNQLAFNLTDRLPITDPVIYAPLQLGLVYLVVFAFFQFLLSLRVQLYVASRVKGVKYIMFRMITSHLAYIVLGFAYAVLNASYKLDYSATFGHSGFLVLWGIGYLSVGSLGSLNENVALLCFTYYPPLIGIWLLLFMVLNTLPTFSAIALCPTFFRYGYAIPVYNAYQLVVVVFFDGYKGEMGRHIGILCAWMIVTNLMLPFTLKYTVKVSKRKLAKAEAENSPEKDLHREKK